MQEPYLLKNQLSGLEQGIVLQSQFRRADLIHQTAQQIQKDFAEFGMEVTFSGQLETAYDELFDQMHGHLKEMLDKNYNRILNFLYRIDLNEKTIVKAEIDYPEYTKVEVICYLIVQREIKKVLIRNYFKEKGMG